jgi:cyanophycin synthetase
VPKIQAKALRAAGVPEDAISIIPDEQEAIAAALEMGRPGDLLLVFADALVRSWKQITKFRPAGTPPAAASAAPRAETFAAAPAATYAAEPTPGAGDARPDSFSLEGLIRDERGVRLAPEVDD